MTYIEYEWSRPDGTVLLRDMVDSRMDFGPGATAQQANELVREPALIVRRKEGRGAWKRVPLPDWAQLRVGYGFDPEGNVVPVARGDA